MGKIPGLNDNDVKRIEAWKKSPGGKKRIEDAKKNDPELENMYREQSERGVADKERGYSGRG